MRKKISLVLGGLSVMLAAMLGLGVWFGAFPERVVAGTMAQGGAFAVLVNSAGETSGNITVREDAEGKVSVNVNAHNLQPGFHGFHIHETGLCGPPDFQAAGGHLHIGEEVSHPEHMGDLPVLYVNADGTASMTFTTDRFGVMDLFDRDGTAFIVHADPDNYANIPDRYMPPDAETVSAGDAGARSACGVIAPSPS